MGLALTLIRGFPLAGWASVEGMDPGQNGADRDALSGCVDYGERAPAMAVAKLGQGGMNRQTCAATPTPTPRRSRGRSEGSTA